MCQPLLDHRRNRHSSEPPSNRSHHPPLRSLSRFLVWPLIGLCCLESNLNSVRADGTVMNCDQPSLETALAAGGHVTFACSGVIVLTSTISITTDTVLDGTGQSVTISGNDLVRLFYVATNVSFNMVKLTLAHGNHVGAPGDAQTPGGGGYGGALFIDGGVLHATDCQFSANRASGWAGNTPGDAYGGAIYNRSGSLNLTNCTFISNLTVGGGAAGGFVRAGAGMGGAIYNDTGTLRTFGTRFFANAAQGGVSGNPTGGSGGFQGAAFGGALGVTTTSGPGGTPSTTIPVQATLTDPKAAGTLDQAPVTVNITTGSSPGPVLAVPVTALVAQSPGGYAVEVTGPGNTRRWVPVRPGMFDDADGLVQVTGNLTPGQHVVVAAS